jgi:hypothetical protein
VSRKKFTLRIWHPGWRAMHRSEHSSLAAAKRRASMARWEWPHGARIEIYNGAGTVVARSEAKAIRLIWK